MTIRAIAKKPVGSEGSPPKPGWRPVSSDETGTTYQDHNGRVMTVRHRTRQSPSVGVASSTVASEPELGIVPAADTKPIRAPKTAPTAKPPTTAEVKREKKKPTGDYETGYCRPPVDGQFDGSKPGPGRPKNSVSQDTLFKKHLTQVRAVAVAGKSKKMQAREIFVVMLLNKALGGDRQALKDAIAHASRLFADNDNHGGKTGPSVDRSTDLDATDQAILDAYEASLLARLLGAAEGDDPNDEADDAVEPNDPDEEQTS